MYFTVHVNSTKNYENKIFNINFACTINRVATTVKLKVAYITETSVLKLLKLACRSTIHISELNLVSIMQCKNCFLSEYKLNN